MFDFKCKRAVEIMNCHAARNTAKKHLPESPMWKGTGRRHFCSSPEESEPTHDPSSCIDEWKSLIDYEFCLISPAGIIYNLDKDSYLTDHQEYHYDEP